MSAGQVPEEPPDTERPGNLAAAGPSVLRSGGGGRPTSRILRYRCATASLL